MLLKRKPYFVNFTSLPPPTSHTDEKKICLLTNEKALVGVVARTSVRRQASSQALAATGDVSR
jgi:hypothetical protein